jgi:hypothetical protein
MNYHNTIFHQVLNFLPRGSFDAEVQATGADRYTKHFTARVQLIVNLYAQVSGKKSLRDIEAGLKVQHGSWYHLGIANIARSTVSYANSRRDYRLYENLFYRKLQECRDYTPRHKFRFKNPLYTLDSTTIDLCLSVFPWAKYRKTKGALKLHALLDHQGSIPSFVVVHEARRNDVKVARETDLPLSRDSIVVMDRAYFDFQWLHGLAAKGVYFVLRAKNNTQYQVLGQHKKSKKKAVISDELIRLDGPLTSRKYPDHLRLVTFYDEEKNKTLRFVTNNFHLAASTIADIYKSRWDIENFFKWIKQNLKIKTFLGTSHNAVLTQIWTAMIYYLLLAYIKFQNKYAYTLLHLARMIREALFKRADIIDLMNLSSADLKRGRDPCPQPTLF